MENKHHWNTGNLTMLFTPMSTSVFYVMLLQLIVLFVIVHFSFYTNGAVVQFGSLAHRKQMY